MRLLDRHILRELLGPFLFGVAAFTSIMFAGRELFKITELMAEFNAPPAVAVRLVVLFLPSLIVMTLPMAMLLSALLGFGRLSGDSESVALFAGGVSLYRIAVPVIVLAILVTGAGFVLNEIIAPQTKLAHERIVRQFENDENAASNKPFLVMDTEGNRTDAVVYVPPSGFGKSSRTLYDIVLIKYKDNKPDIFIFAKKAAWKGKQSLTGKGEWILSDGYSKSLGKEWTSTVQFKGSNTKQAEINKTPEQFDLYQRKPDEMSFSQLRDFIHMLQAQGMDVQEYRVRLYQKIALPLSCLVFALIGTPLGLRPQRSSSAMGLGLSIVIIFAYWVLMHYMTILGANGRFSPMAASFIPTLAGAGIGIALIVRAAK